MSKILVVCTANICRSPVGEALLRDRARLEGLSFVSVVSAGLLGAEGWPASPGSQEVLGERGLDLGDHRSRGLSGEEIEGAALILCMEQRHVDSILESFPAAQHKTLLFSGIAGETRDIEDPHGGPIEGYQTMVDDVVSLIDRGWPRIVELMDLPLAGQE